jgi:hypothetical protein
MAGRLVVEKVSLKSLQTHHHLWLNTFGEQETLVDAVSVRPGFFGPNPVAFLSLIARRPSIQIQDLEEALIHDRTLIRAPAFRGSLFLLNAQDYGIYFRTFSQYLFNRGMVKLAEAGILKHHLFHFGDLIKAHNPNLPMSSAELLNVMFAHRQRPPLDVCHRIIQKLCDIGLLVRASAKGWKGNDFTYALMEKWLPDINLKPDNPETARTETVRRYLLAYGPASMEDISWWTGLPLLQCQRSVGHLRREVVRFNVEGYKDDMLGLRETVDLLRRKPVVEEEFQLLPPWDPYTLGWRCRRRTTDRELLPFVYDRLGNATNVIVDGGKIIGLWQFRDSEVNMLEFHIFAKYRDRKNYALPKIDDWSKTLCKLTQSPSVNIIERPLPKTLAERGEGAFLWPLGKTMSTQVSTISVGMSPMERRTSNTFRQKYLDNEFLVRPTQPARENMGENVETTLE